MNHGTGDQFPGGIDPLSVSDYLRARGWRRDPRDWRGAQVWTPPDGASDQVLLPPELRYRDDRELLLRALHAVARAENEDYQDLLRIVSNPMVDTQYFHTHPPSPSGTVPLLSGMDALEGIRGVFTLAARSVLDEKPSVGGGRNSKAVDDFLRQVRLGPSKAGSYILSAEVPLTPPRGHLLFDDPPAERTVVRAMKRAMSAAERATKAAESNEGSLDPFDEAMEAGVSARLCESLARFGGHDHDQEFSIRFAWAPAQPEGNGGESDQLSFGRRAASILQQAGERLRELEYRGTVRLHGTVIATERQSPRHDGFVKVKGTLSTSESRRERTVLVRLGPEDYSAALTAHARGSTIDVEGRLSSAGNRRELLPSRVLIDGQPIKR